MNNHLDNGTVLPHGLLGINTGDSGAAFNRAYKNTPLRMGIITSIYPYNDPKNYTKLTTEYDVTVLEQNENVSCTNIVYRNCVSAEGMGSVADYFEKNLRTQTQDNNAGGAVNTSGQNGAIVILLCLDAYTQKAVIIGGLTHPDRQTNLDSVEPQLYGEYNGVAVVINPDGSTSLTFNGATNNDGDVIDSSQGTTTVAIATDGSFSVKNAGGSVEIQKSGTINITCTGPANIIAQGVTTVDGSHINLGENASHALILGDVFQTLYNAHTHPTVVGPSGPPVAPMTEAQLSQKTSTE